MGDLSPHFSRREFGCRCGCGAALVSAELLAALEGIRARTARPLTIRSGCRCAAHNAAEGGTARSAHLCDPAAGEACEAADLAAPTPRDRYHLLRAALLEGLPRIGVGRDFVHVDVDPALDQEVCWLY